MPADTCRACGAPCTAPVCVECGTPRDGGDELRFEHVTWKRGDLPVAEMRRRLGRRLSAQYAVLAGWELAEQAAARTVEAPPPAALAPVAPEPVVAPVPAPTPPPPRRFVIPAVEASSASEGAFGTMQAALLERLGWWLGGFLLVAGAVFLVGTVWAWLPGPVRVAAEIGAVMAAAGGLAGAGAALVRRRIGAGRGLAAVGLALSVVGSVVIGVEGATPGGLVGCGVVFAAATAVAWVARGAELTAVPALAWGLGALLPALAWLAPALAWPAVAASLLLVAWTLRAAVLERRPVRAGPMLGAVLMLTLAVTLAATPVTGAAVLWILAPCAGAAAIWVDAARGRWRGVPEPVFSRPEAVLGVGLTLASTLGLLAATLGAGWAAFVGGALAVALLSLLAVRHEEPWLVRAWSVAALAVPAALLGALGVKGSGAVSGWFFCAAFAVPVLLAARARLDDTRGAAVIDVLLGAGALAVCGAVERTPTGLVTTGAWLLAVGWATASTARAGALACAHLLALALAAASVWMLDGGVGGVVLAWTGLALAVDGLSRALAVRAALPGHPVMPLARVASGLAVVTFVLGLHGLAVSRAVDPLLLVLAASVGLVAAGAWLGHRHRDEALGWALAVPVAVGISVVRPLLGLRADPAIGLLAATCGLGLAALLVARDRAPFRRFGVEVTGEVPSGWLATPLWRSAQLLWLAVACAAAVEVFVGRYGLASALAAGLLVTSLGQAGADRRSGSAGLPALLLEVAGPWIVGALALEAAWFARTAVVPVGVGLAVAALTAIAAGALGWRPADRAQATAIGLTGLAVGAFGFAVLSGPAAPALGTLGFVAVPPAAVGALGLVVSAPLLALAVGRRELPWSVAAMGVWAVAASTAAAPWVHGPGDAVLALALGSVALTALATGVARRDLAGAVHPAMTAAAVLAATSASVAAVLPIAWAPEALRSPEVWPVARALALASWGALVLASRWRWLTLVAGLVCAAEALVLAHGAGLAFSSALEVGAVTLAAAVAVLLGARGLGATALDAPAEEWEESPADDRPLGPRVTGPLAAVVALGLVPALLAALAPVSTVLGGSVAASASAVVWAAAASVAFGSVWPMTVGFVALAVAAGHGLGAVGVALVAAGAGWAVVPCRRVAGPEARSAFAAELASQVLVPATVIVSCAALVWGAWNREPLGLVAAVVAVGALGPVPSGWRAPIATLAPSLVAVFAVADVAVVDGLLVGGALALAAWSFATGAGWLALAQVAAAVAVATAWAAPVGVWVATWAGLAVVLALPIRRGSGEAWLAGAALASFAGATVLGVDLVGWWTIAPLAVVVAAAWTETARALSLPGRAAAVLVLAGAVAALGSAEHHRAAALASLGLATLVAGRGWWRTPDLATATGTLVLALSGVVAARIGTPPTVVDALLWIGLGAVAVASADATVRWLPERWASATAVLRTAAMVLPFVGLGLAAWVTGIPAPAVFAAAAATWALSHARFREPASLLLAFVAVDLAVASGLERAGRWDPTLYVLPFALSAGALAQLWRTRLPDAAVNGLRWSAAGILYAVAFARLVSTADNVVLGVGIGLLGLVAGAGLKVRAWIWSGAAFLVAVVSLQAARFGIAQQLGLGVVLSLAGVLVLGGMVGWTLWRRASASTPSP